MRDMWGHASCRKKDLASVSWEEFWEVQKQAKAAQKQASGGNYRAFAAV